MQTKEIDYSIIRSIQLSNESDSSLFFYDQKCYKVGKVLKAFIQNLQLHNYNIALELTAKEHELTAKEKEVLIIKLDLLLEKLKNKAPQKSYIFLKKSLFNQQKTNFIANKLKNIFSFNLLYPILTIAFVLNFVFFFKNQSIIFTKINLDISEVLFFYCSMLLILLTHEFGHSSACKFFGIPPKEIGFGVYLFFPILYSNVSDIWSLQKNKRIIVNLGGIYFQLIINAILILLFFLIKNNHFQKIDLMLLKVNSIIIIYSLLPFARNDGYWIYSDYFNIPNLNKEANKYPIVLLTQIFRRGKNIKLNFQKSSLAFYSIGNYIFLCYVFTSFFAFILVLFFNLKKINYSNSITTIASDLYPYLLKIIVTAVFLVLFIKQFISWIKLITTEITKSI